MLRVSYTTTAQTTDKVQNNIRMTLGGISATYTRHLKQSTPRARNIASGHGDRAFKLPDLTTIQLLERRRCHVETMAGGVDGSHDDCRAVLRVSDSPTPAAIGRVPRDVESTADVRVGGA